MIWPFNRKKKVETPPETDEQIALKVARFYFDSRDRVAAIKEFRGQTGHGLKEAKCLIDEAWSIVWVEKNSDGKPPLTIGDLIKAHMENRDE